MTDENGNCVVSDFTIGRIGKAAASICAKYFAFDDFPFRFCCSPKLYQALAEVDGN